MIKKLPVFILLIVFMLTSCDEDNSTSLNETIHVNLNEAKKGLKLSAIIGDPKFILLNDPQENPLVSPYQFQFKNNKIYVRDLDYDNIHIYSESGQFIRAIFSSGEGPQEFRQINDFFVTENEIIIQDTFLRKIIVFDQEGNFLLERKHLINNSRLAVSETKFLYYMANDPEFDHNNYLVEERGEIISKFLQIEPELENSGKFLLPNSFVPTGKNRFLFYRPYTYQINFLDLTRNKLGSSISFDFGQAQLSASQHRMPSNFKNQLIQEKNLVSQFISVLPTTNGIIISFLRGNSERFYLYLDLEAKSTLLISEPENDLIPIKLNSPWTSDGDRIYFFLNSIDFYNQYVEGFTGENVSLAEGNIHHFFQMNKGQLVEDRSMLISFKVKENIMDLAKH